MCENAVKPDVYRTLESLDLASGKGPLIREWGCFYGNLMKALAKERTIRFGKTFSENVEKNDFIDKTVDSVMNAENPLAAELILLKSQFDYLDGLVAMHSFDDYVLFGYAVKLRLLERQTAFDKEKGKEEFKRLFENIQTQILNI